MTRPDLPQQLESLHAISVGIAALHELPQIYDRALTFCLELTSSAMGFVGLLSTDADMLDVVAVKGFAPADPGFFERFQRIPVRPSVFGIVITEGQPHISGNVERDPQSVGTPPGHPGVGTFLGVPLRVGDTVIGMIGVANNPKSYGQDDLRVMATFANQVAVAIENARLYARQRDMIDRLGLVQQRLTTAERDQLLSSERDRIAAGLHDEIEQEIFVIGIQINRLLEHDFDPEVDKRLREIQQIATRAAANVRDVIFALAVSEHREGDLAESIEQLLDEIPRSAGLRAQLAVRGTLTPTVGYVQGAVHAVVKEALTNVVKHARASSVLITIGCAPDGLDVVVQDDGSGASNNVLREGLAGHFGLRNMRRYTTVLGGTFEAHTDEDGGVTISAHIPLTPPSES